MKTSLILTAWVFLALPALAQTSGNPASRASPDLPNASGNFPVLSPFQALAKVIQNPTRPPTPSPVTPVSGAPLPSAIPPNTVGNPAPGR